MSNLSLKGGSLRVTHTKKQKVGKKTKQVEMLSSEFKVTLSNPKCKKKKRLDWNG